MTPSASILRHSPPLQGITTVDRAPLLSPADIAARLNLTIEQTYVLLRAGGALHSLRIDLGHKTVRVDSRKLEKLIAAGGVAVCN